MQIEPAFQELEVSDTQASVAGQLRLTNQSPVAQTFEIFALDIQQFDSAGRVALADKPLTGTTNTLADFIIIPITKWTIESNQQAEIPFWVSNAPRLSPGGHYAALVARLVPSQTAQQEVLPALSSFVLVRKIGGELYHLSLKPIDSTRQSIWWSIPKTLPLTFSNQGNIHVAPRGTVDFADVFGHITHRGVINESSLFVFPGSQRTIPVTLQNIKPAWPIMLYQIKVAAYSQPGSVQASHQSMLFIIQPSALIGGIGICSLLAAGWVYFHRKRH